MIRESSAGTVKWVLMLWERVRAEERAVGKGREKYMPP